MKKVFNLRYLLISFINFVNHILRFDKNIREFITEYEKQFKEKLPKTTNESLILDQYQDKKKRLYSNKDIRRNIFALFLVSLVGEFTWLFSLRDDPQQVEEFFTILGFAIFLTLGVIYLLTSMRLQTYKIATELRLYEEQFDFLDNEFSLNYALKYEYGLKNKFISATNLYRFTAILVLIGEIKLLVFKLLDIFL